ncbi:MAG TPA: hypothetical protein VK524_15970 [Polyangiaceae bacterium]|nr:hypothetical protein [Polyangiaceae bacterium]
MRSLLRFGLGCALTLGACDSGRQVIAWEVQPDAQPPSDFPGDEYLPWFGGPEYYGRWPRGLPADESYWPIGVWSQNSQNAQRFQDVGVNLFNGVYENPPAEALSRLSSAGIGAISGREHFDDVAGDAALRAWLLFEQPDNAQITSSGFDPCIQPAEVLSEYESLAARDRTRPILLQLGRGLVEPDWEGRGVCMGLAEHYPDYVRAADVLSAVIYPLEMQLAVTTNAAAVDGLRALSFDEKPVFAFIQASSIWGEIPVPEQIRFQVWLGIVHGAAGVQYYCHRQTEPKIETECLDHAPTRDVLRALNSEIRELAPVLNSRPVANGVAVTSPALHTRLWRHAGNTYLFAVSAAAAPLTARFSLRDFPETAAGDVLYERRSVAVERGAFEDVFEPYAVHLYRLHQR